MFTRPLSLGRAIRLAIVILLLLPFGLMALVYAIGPIMGDRMYGSLVVENGCPTELGLVIREGGPVGESWSDPLPLPAGEWTSVGSFDREGTFNVLVLGPTGQQYRAHARFDEDDPEVTIRIAGAACPG